MSKRVLVGMSGGIDSSIAAYLLVKEGYEVIGFTQKLWAGGSRCCDIKDIMSAQKLSHYLGIRHYTIDLTKEFQSTVVDYFVNDYLNGRTPNPCVVCNDKIKFGYVFDKLSYLDFDYLATGHYAKIVNYHGKSFVAKGKDNKKSQEYFLARMVPGYIDRLLFPLGDLTKDEVKNIAATIDFDFTLNESQEVCFIKEGTTHADFIENALSNSDTYKGKVVNQDNKLLKEGDPYYKFTVGQRKGIGIGGGTPLYVTSINAGNKTIMVGEKKDAYRKSMVAVNPHWFMDYHGDPIHLDVKFRYNSPSAKATIAPLQDDSASDSHTSMKLSITFDEEQFGLAPGQLSVFYDDDRVLGSAWIDAILSSDKQ